MEIIAVTLGWVLNQRVHLKGISTSSGGRWAFHPCDRPDGLTSTSDEDGTLLRSPLESSSHPAQATPPSCSQQQVKVPSPCGLDPLDPDREMLVRLFLLVDEGRLCYPIPPSQVPQQLPAHPPVRELIDLFFCVFLINALTGHGRETL